MAIITLTSDIGHQDFLTGAIKGTLLSLIPEANLVDISHELSPFNYPQAAYMCHNAIKRFPKNSFHLILVNLFDKKNDHLLLIRHKEKYYAVADNGLITMILQEKPVEVTALPIPDEAEHNTLLYTEIWAKACKQILAGKKLSEIGNVGISIEEKNHLKPFYGPQFIEGHIIFIDHFENVIINITRKEFEEHRKDRKFKIVFKRDEVIEKISDTYADVSESEKLAHFNSAGYLEIAINKGNAAGLFGLERFVDSKGNAQYMHGRLLYQTVKIMFE